MSRFRPGVSFSDFVIKDSSSRKSKVSDDGSQSRISVGTWVWLGATICMLLLVARLGSLELLQGGKYRVLAEENRVQKISIPAPRGVIYDDHSTTNLPTIPICL
jgi:cell division protein FtsI/penicillin-binding protein 2